MIVLNLWLNCTPVALLYFSITDYSDQTEAVWMEWREALVEPWQGTMHKTVRESESSVIHAQMLVPTGFIKISHRLPQLHCSRVHFSIRQSTGKCLFIFSFLFKFILFFLAHLILRIQMCYCCQKLEIWNRPQMHSCLIGSDSKSASNVQDLPSNVQRFGTFEAKLIYFVMWCVWANQTAQTAVHLRPIPNRPQMYRIGLKCTVVWSDRSDVP